MPIEFPCSSCGANLRVPEGSAGKKAKCPTCQAVNVIPGASTISPVPATPVDSVPKPDTVPSMPSPLDDPFGMKDEDLLRNAGSQDWGIDDFAESDNPFQAPHDYDGVPAPAVRLTDSVTPTKLYVGQTLVETFRNFFGHFLAYLLTSLAMILTIGVVYVGMGMGMFVLFPALLWPDAAPENVIMASGLMFFALIIFCMIIMGVLGIGFLSCFISIAKTGKASMAAFSKGVKKFLPCLGYGIILVLVNFGLGILQNIALLALSMPGGGGNLRMLILFLVLVVIAILNFLVNFRLIWGMWLIIDQNLSVGNALRVSREIGKGNAWKAFLIFLVLGILVTAWVVVMMLVSSTITDIEGETFQILGVVIFGVLYILTALLMMPFFSCHYTIMYLLMSGQHPAVSQPETEW